MLDINKLIMAAMKEKNQTEVQVLRAIKTEFTKYETAKSGNTITDTVEATILNKMKTQREDSINQFRSANRMDLVEAETAELEVIKKYAPKEASLEEIESCIKDWMHEGVTIKNMGQLITHVKSIFPTANGKVVSDIFKTYL